MIFGVVGAITDDEYVFDLEAHEIAHDLGFATARLVDQRACPNRECLRFEQAPRLTKRPAGVRDVVDEENLSQHGGGRRTGQGQLRWAL